jgi:hypothetical protein
MKLVQMPTALLRVEDADLDAAVPEPNLLAAFRAYLPDALTERRGLLILASPTQGGHHLLMLLARRIGAALRDANIHLRDAGGDMQVGKLRLCYLPGPALVSALVEPDVASALTDDAACFVQDLEAVDLPRLPSTARSGLDALRSLLDQRLAAGRPTFLQVAPDSLSPALETMLRERLPVLESASARL